MSTSSSCQPVLQVDMLLKVHINVHVNLKFSIHFISACSCQPQVLVNLKFMSTLSSCQPQVHVNLKFMSAYITSGYVVECTFTCQPTVHLSLYCKWICCWRYMLMFMSTSSSSQPVLQRDVWLKVYVDCSLCTSNSCHLQVHVILYYK